MKRKTKFLAFFVTAFLVAFAIFYGLGFRVVLERSIPTGIYRLVPGGLSKGDFVAFHLPDAWSNFALRRGYLKPDLCRRRDRFTIKHVAASQGDSVQIDSSGIWVNKQLLAFSRPLRVDSKGRPLPAFSLSPVTLKEGEFLVISHHRTNGLDSRYYGILSSENMISRAKLVLEF